MMISPDDHLHSRSIVDDGAADSGEKELLRIEPFVDSIRGYQEEKIMRDKKSKNHNLLKKTLPSSSGQAECIANVLLGYEGDNASTSSSSSSSVSSAHSSACTSTDEVRINKVSPRQGTDKATVGAGSDSSSLRAPKTLTAKYTAVCMLRPADILLGRGKPFQSHPGNQFMLHAVDQLRDQYMGTDRKGKHNIIEHVLGLITGQGGRFLDRIDENEENSPWMEVKRSISYRKVGHAFRSKARRAPAATTGSLNPPDWLMQKESGVPRSSSTGSSSRHGSQTSRRGAEADTAGSRRSSKHDEDFIFGNPFLTAAQGGQQLKFPPPLLSKSHAQLMSGAWTGVAPFMKGLHSRATHSRITAVNPLLRLPDRLPASSGLTRLIQENHDHATIWALQQQQQQHHLMALSNMAALEQRLAAQYDAVLVLRDREQQILNLHDPSRGVIRGFQNQHKRDLRTIFQLLTPEIQERICRK